MEPPNNRAHANRNGIIPLKPEYRQTTETNADIMKCQTYEEFQKLRTAMTDQRLTTTLRLTTVIIQPTSNSTVISPGSKEKRDDAFQIHATSNELENGPKEFHYQMDTYDNNIGVSSDIGSEV
jgi:hypothetical protein